MQSFKHAVTILGYDKLNKWLSLLLVTASKDPMAPTLMHTALTRARLMEQLGHGLVDKSEYDNLFITGAFSMLDLLLGVTMDQALDAMHLPEPITDALLGNKRHLRPVPVAGAGLRGRGGRIAGRTGGHARPHGRTAQSRTTRGTVVCRHDGILTAAARRCKTEGARGRLSSA